MARFDTNTMNGSRFAVFERPDGDFNIQIETRDNHFTYRLTKESTQMLRDYLNEAFGDDQV